MAEQPASVVEWVAGHIYPYERELRDRLRGLGSPAHEIDDIIQDAYLHIAELPGIGHIRDGRAYLFATARKVLLNRVRHERIVRIHELASGDALAMIDETPDPERWAQAREELARVAELIRDLPVRCRQVFELRRIEGVSQRMIADRLGISEHLVEYEASRGLRLLLRALGRQPQHTRRRGLKRRALDLVARKGDRS